MNFLASSQVEGNEDIWGNASFKSFKNIENDVADHPYVHLR